MKKLKLSGKLSLNKETVARLSDEQMQTAKGGGFLSIGANCTVSAAGTCYGTDHSKSLFCNPQ